jgi:hypothetical protein
MNHNSVPVAIGSVQEGSGAPRRWWTRPSEPGTATFSDGSDCRENDLKPCKQIAAAQRPNVGVGSKAPFWTSADDFRSSPMNRHSQCQPACLKSAKGRPDQYVRLFAKQTLARNLWRSRASLQAPLPVTGAELAGDHRCGVADFVGAAVVVTGEPQFAWIDQWPLMAAIVPSCAGAARGPSARNL